MDWPKNTLHFAFAFIAYTIYFINLQYIYYYERKLLSPKYVSWYNYQYELNTENQMNKGEKKSNKKKESNKKNLQKK